MDYTIDEIVHELEGFVYWLADYRQSDTVLMEADEIVGELFEELVKGFQHYEKKELTRSQMCAVIKRMMDNRISELVYKYYGTHRKQGNNAVDLDSLYEMDDDSEAGGVLHIKSAVIVQSSISIEEPERLYDSKNRVLQTINKLSSPETVEVFKALIAGNKLLTINLELAGERLSTVRKSTCEVTIKPWYVADALGMDESVVAKCFEEIRQAYKEICIEYGE